MWRELLYLLGVDGLGWKTLAAADGSCRLRLTPLLGALFGAFLGFFEAV